MMYAYREDLPAEIEGYGTVKPYKGVWSTVGERTTVSAHRRSVPPVADKRVPSLEEAIIKSGLRDGMTVSFHHHLRNGDKVLNLVMNTIAVMGFRDIRVAASGIFPCHEPLVELMEQGVVTGVTTSTFNPGPVPKAITAGKLRYPAVLMSHGGRARAIESGELHIDVAFIAAPSCDVQGNINGTQGPSACGFLSYCYADADYADCVIAVTDNLVSYPNHPIEIGQHKVDMVVEVDSIGASAGIVSGTTQITEDPTRLDIAADAARLMDACGMIRNDMSFQTGAGGISLAVAARVRDMMLKRGIQGSFGVGGIHGYFIQMLEEGLFRSIFDVQCFDLEAIRSAAKDSRHMAVSASQYGNIHAKGCVLHGLDTVILGATEIDTDFNVNVITGSNGVIMGASGGHEDCAAGAKLTVIVANLTRKQFCVVRDRVTTITTPGETVDAFVCEHGIAINPRRTDLLEKLANSSLPIVPIERLRAIGEDIAGPQVKASFSSRIVAVAEYRDGTVTDVVRMPQSVEDRGVNLANQQ